MTDGRAKFLGAIVATMALTGGFAMFGCPLTQLRIAALIAFVAFLSIALVWDDR